MSGASEAECFSPVSKSSKSPYNSSPSDSSSSLRSSSASSDSFQEPVTKQSLISRRTYKNNLMVGLSFLTVKISVNNFMRFVQSFLGTKDKKCLQLVIERKQITKYY